MQMYLMSIFGVVNVGREKGDSEADVRLDESGQKGLIRKQPRPKRNYKCPFFFFKSTKRIILLARVVSKSK